MNLTLTERYLVGYHDARAGATARAFQHLPVQSDAGSFTSTYHALLAALPVAPAPDSVLDLACGDGHLLALLAAAAPACSLVGADLSGGELAAARARLGDRAALCHAKAQQLPLATASVDAVLSHMALMLMDDVECVIADVRRVLRPGGVFAGVVGAQPPPDAALDAFIGLYPASAQRSEFAGIRFGDRRFRSQDGIRSLLEPAFDALVFTELSLVRDCTPAQLWGWYEGMYDTDLLLPAAQASLRDDCLRAWHPLCGSDGTLRCEDRCLLFSARAAR